MHVAFVPLTGLRIVNEAVRAVGPSLPDLRRRGEAVQALPPLGLLTLAGQLPDGVGCSWHPASHVDDALLQSIVSEAPDLVAISATTPTVEEAYALSARLRKEGILTVLGGLHATACPEEAERHVDAVVVGDGESSWPQVIADARRGALRPRYQQAWQPQAEDWVPPRFDLHAGGGRWTLQTQRGCPFACSFCAASRLLGSYREKPVSVVASELAAIQALDPDPLIELADDNTFAVRRDAGALLDVLGESGATWFTEADWRLGERPEIVERLADAGCVQILIGLESPVHRHPGMGAKDEDLPRMLAAIDRLHDAGIVVHGCFIVGVDGETRASLDALGDFVLASELADVQITLETPFPGTTLRARREREGRMRPGATWSRHTLFDVVHTPDRMSPEDLEQGFLALLGRVHAPEAVARRDARRRRIWRRARIGRASGAA